MTGSAAGRAGGPAIAGTALGALLAVILLILAGAQLLSVEGTSPKVLASVWLAALPVLGILTGTGYAIGSLLAGPGSPPSRDDGQAGIATMGGNAARHEPEEDYLTQSGLGGRLQEALDRVEQTTAGTPLGASLLGVGLALTCIVGGIATFLLVLLFLVSIFTG